MSSKNSKHPSAFQTKVEKLTSGFTENPPASLTSLTVEGQSQTTSAIVAELQAIDGRVTTVVTARESLSLAVATRKAASADDEAYVASVEASLKVQFEGDQETLNAFGIAAKKARAAPNPKVLVVAAEKAAATHEARGTMSKKQRLAISATPAPTVTVSGVGATPAAPSSASESTPPPASVAVAPAAVSK